jgi:hypothetical protein
MALDGFYAGMEGKSSLDNGGFVFGNAGESSKFDLKLNNVTLGNTGSSAIGTFNGLKMPRLVILVQSVFLQLI